MHINSAKIMLVYEKTKELKTIIKIEEIGVLDTYHLFNPVMWQPRLITQDADSRHRFQYLLGLPLQGVQKGILLTSCNHLVLVTH
jgi:hypothetical protein